MPRQRNGPGRWRQSVRWPDFRAVTGRVVRVDPEKIHVQFIARQLAGFEGLAGPFQNDMVSQRVEAGYGVKLHRKTLESGDIWLPGAPAFKSIGYSKP